MEPVKVICKKNTKKLIKGATYLIYSKEDDIVSIPNIGKYTVNNFTLPDGKHLSTLNNFNYYHYIYQNTNELKLRTTNYVGQLVKCQIEYRYIKKDEIYYVENQDEINWKVKLRGIKNLIPAYYLKEIPITEQRRLKIKNLQNDEEIKTGDKTRKFLLYTEKEKLSILLNTFTNAIYDLNNTLNHENINFIKLIIDKGIDYNITEEDIKPFLNLTLQELYSLYSK